VARGEAAPELLDSYEPERKPIHAEVLTQTDRMTRVGLTKNPLVKTLRNHLAPVVMALPVAQRQLGSRIAELTINYRGSPIVAERRLSGGPAAGEHAPDADVSLGSVVHRLTEFFRHGSHTLLLFSGSSPSDKALQTLLDLGERVRQQWPTLVVPHLLVASNAWATKAGGRPPLVDVRGSAQKAYGAKAACLYLVRPDGYVAFRGPASAGEALLAHLSRWLREPAASLASSSVA
jgi:hypothetical protein